MNKFILFFSIFLVSCCNKPKLLQNGLTRSAYKITEYAINVANKDSNNKNLDTIVITNKRFNKSNKILAQTRHTPSDGQKMETNYIYNRLGKLEKEIVTMSIDSLPLEVNYIYNNNLLDQTISRLDNRNERFEQIEKYYYRSNNTKEKTTTSLLLIRLNTSDTIINSISTSYFDKKELIKSIETKVYNNQKLNSKTVYEYDCETLTGLKHFNQNDSLTSTSKYEYKFDRFNNWVEKKIFENNTVKSIIKREIEYNWQY